MVYEVLWPGSHRTGERSGLLYGLRVCLWAAYGYRQYWDRAVRRVLRLVSGPGVSPVWNELAVPGRRAVWVELDVLPQLHQRDGCADLQPAQCELRKPRSRR